MLTLWVLVVPNHYVILFWITFFRDYVSGSLGFAGDVVVFIKLLCKPFQDSLIKVASEFYSASESKKYACRNLGCSSAGGSRLPMRGKTCPRL